ncbi:MAG TPA: protein-L-isoaspartate(D-aspartate) O-methyltransferase [Thermoanaerobaculia bacterium]|nr:protein-L-isoaspartate(D-aspartate) O-methyltransferase [Thermoanaerobaculia bacterium]
MATKPTPRRGRRRLARALSLGLLGLWCLGSVPGPAAGQPDPPGLPAAPAVDLFSAARKRMVEEQIRDRGIVQAGVLAAMESVPRHLFVPAEERARAYDDQPLPIGHGQTISQPYIVALMTSLLELDSNDRVLEIGTGSGYQAAVLSRLAGEVYSIEILKPLGERAKQSLARQGYSNVQVRIGDGYKGWPSAAPFDAIILTAAPPRIPDPLVEQLKVGGKMVLPVGDTWQDLLVLTKRPDGSFEKRKVLPVRFVPMTGQAQQEARRDPR